MTSCRGEQGEVIFVSVDGVDVIATAGSLFFYALDVLKGPLPAGEDIIASSPQFSFLYALMVVRGRWEIGEPAISNSDFEERYCERFEISKCDLFSFSHKP